MQWYTFMNTLGRPVEQLAVCLANKQKSTVEVKVQQLCKASAKCLRMFNEKVTPIPMQQDNGGVRAFWVQNYSMFIARVFNV